MKRKLTLLALGLFFALALAFTFGAKTAKADDPHKHCNCMDTVGVANAHGFGHKCDNNQVWTKVSNLTEFMAMADVTDHSYFYLDTDIVVTEPLQVPSYKLYLCLNGHSITSTTGRVFELSKATTADEYCRLYITDCQENVGTISGASTENGGTIYVSGGRLYIYRAIVTSTGESTTATGGVIYVIGKSTVTSIVYLMEGAVIRDGKAKIGGNIATSSYATLNIYGATITGGYSTTYGGNLNVGNTTNIYEKTVISNGSGTYAGNMCVRGTTTIDGAEIYGGKARTSYGGNISIMAGKTLTFKSGKIHDGEATAGNGGNVEAYGGTFKMSGGEIYNGKVNRETGDNGKNGGNVHITGYTSSGTTYSATMTMSGGKIYNGEAKIGGNLYVGGNIGTKCTITGGEIYNGRSTSSGGNVYLATCVVTMTGGSIYDGGQRTYSGETYTDNTNYAGSNVYMDSQTGEYSFTGGEIKGRFYCCENYLKLTVGGSVRICSGGTNGMYIANTNTSTKVQNIEIVPFTEDGLIQIYHFNQAGNANWTGSTDTTLFAKAGEGVTASDMEHIKITGGVGKTIALEEDGYFHIYEGWTKCVCGGALENGHTYGTGTGAVTHVCNPETWTAWTSTTTLPTVNDMGEPGEYYYYLTGNVKLAKSWNPYLMSDGKTSLADASGYTLHLDFAGLTVAMDTSGRFMTDLGNSVYGKNITLTFTDSNGGGGVQIKKNYAASTNGGTMFWLNSKSGAQKITVYGGTFDTNGSSHTTASGAIQIASAGTEFNIFGGTFTGMKNAAADSTNSAATFYVSNGTLNIYGGEIIGGTASKGGTIMVTGSSAVVNQYGGVVRDGKAISVSESTSGSNRGGNLYLTNGGIYNLYDGAILDGRAQMGGNVFIFGTGVFNMKGGTISGGYSGTNGANIALFYDSSKYSTFTMDGGVVGDTAEDNTKSNIGISGYGSQENHSTFTMNGGTIQGIQSISGEFILNDGTVAGKAITYTGANGIITVNGGYISEVTTSGGKVVLRGGYLVKEPDASFVDTEGGYELFQVNKIHDGVNYYYAVSQGVIVLLTSTSDIENIESGEYIGSLQGPGTVLKDEPFTITASVFGSYQFKGWYTTGRTLLSTDVAYLVADGVSETTTFVALYEPVTSYVNLSATSAEEFVCNYRNSVEEVMDQTSVTSVSKNLLVGTSVKLIYKGQANFFGWFNQTKKLVSAAKEYEFIIGTDTVLQAKTSVNNDLQVLFISDSDQILRETYYGSLTGLEEVPARFGKTALGWRYDGKVYTADAAGFESFQADVSEKAVTNTTVVLRAEYEYDQTNYTVKLQKVTVTDATTLDGWKNSGSAETVLTDAKSYVSAHISLGERTVSGHYFIGFTDKEVGTILSRSENLTYRVDHDVTLFAVFAPSPVEEEALIAWSLKKVTPTGEKYTYSLEVIRDIPKKYRLVEQGVLITYDALLETDDYNVAVAALSVTGDATKYAKFTSGNLEPNNSLLLNLKNIPSSLTVFARGFATYLNALGEAETVYTDVAYGTGAGPITTKAEEAGINWNDDEFTGVIFEVPGAVSVVLYKGTDTDEKIDADNIVIKDGMKRCYYSGIAAGRYNYKMSGSGYYTINTALYLNAEEVGAHTLIEDNPGLKAVGGFQPSSAKSLSKKLLENAMSSDPANWPDYQYAFESPYFLRENKTVGKNQQTTWDEMFAFFDTLPKTNLKIFSYGTSPKYSFDMPVVVLTTSDISACTTYEQAAAIVNANGKMTVEINGGMHGNEPAGAEGALALIKMLTTSKGAGYLANANFVIIPRLNPDSACDYIRNEPILDFDPNGDNLKLEAYTIEKAHDVYYTFKPEVYIDLHEYTGKNDQTGTGVIRDILTGNGGSMWVSDTIQTLSMNALTAERAALTAQGLSSKFYPRDSIYVANTNAQTNGRGYFALNGSLTFLIETYGIGMNYAYYERRVAGQCIACEALIKYVCDNAEAVKAAVVAEKAAIVAAGTTYDATNLLPLDVTSSSTNYGTCQEAVINFTTGQYTGTYDTFPTRLYDTVTLSRSRATAYVIAKDTPGVDKVLALLAKHRIVATEMGNGYTVDVRQYDMTGGCHLLNETSVTFENGAYVFKMNQEQANILAVLMEPDASHATGNFVQAGTITANKLYRFEKDLSELP